MTIAHGSRVEDDGDDILFFCGGYYAHRRWRYCGTVTIDYHRKIYDDDDDEFWLAG